eukprot:COSAG02_NODE_4441_length_5354_cov_3.167650_3_plen_93_part_00
MPCTLPHEGGTRTDTRTPAGPSVGALALTLAAGSEPRMPVCEPEPSDRGDALRVYLRYRRRILPYVMNSRPAGRARRTVLVSSAFIQCRNLK